MLQNNKSKMSNNAYDVVVDANSIENISNGWTVEYTDEGKKLYDSKKDEKSCVFGVVGNKNKGKSILLTKLAAVDLPSRHSITTKGLSVKYPEDKYKNIILFDTAGLETPLTETEYYNVEAEEEEEDEHINEIENENSKNQKIKT